jgi:membrane dipeptidase
MAAIISNDTARLLKETVVWDNHACLPLRPEDDTFLPQLVRYKTAGVNLVSLNVCFDMYPPETAFKMLAAFRWWISRHPEDYVLAETVDDIEMAKATGKLAVVFDIEGGTAVEAHPGLVEIFYRLGVRWMLIAYNKNNRLGGGCQDDDTGLTKYGRQIIDEMERVGMVLCCSHTGYRTARDALEYSRNPVIFSHSNPRALKDHARNIPDELMRSCAQTGGVVSLNGIGIFLGENDNSTETLLRHIEYAVELVGAEHVGLGLDYVFDQKESDDYIQTRPDMFPAENGYCTGLAMIEPERFPLIAEALLKRGHSEKDVRGIMGDNSLRVARRVWGIQLRTRS